MWDLEGNELQHWHGGRINDLVVTADGAHLVRKVDASLCVFGTCPLPTAPCELSRVLNSTTAECIGT